MKKLLQWHLLAAFLILTNLSFSQIISQYVETNSGTTPKGIEIWNNTAGALDFATNNLVIQQGTNGGAPADLHTISAGTLAANAVIVIGTADMEATALGNGAAFSLRAFSFNGDDALVVKYGGTTTDIFGTPGTDPGNSWTGGAVNTANQNIELLAGISSGSLTGWADPSTRFSTVSTTPATLPAGLTGFGIAPAGGGGGNAEAPAFSPIAGTYYSAQNVTITSATAGASIYYTTNGSTPTAASTLYTVPVNISATTTLKAIAIKAGLTDSPVTTGIYTINTPVACANMAALRAQADDNTTVYQLNSQAFLTFKQTYRNQKFIQDATGGILIDDNGAQLTTVYNLGDGITGMIGKLTTYLGMLQFVPIQDAGAATSTGNVINPLEITATDFVNNFETYEGRLVKLSNMTFTTPGGNFANGQVYAMTDPNTVSVDFRTTFYDVNYIGTVIPAGGMDIVGIANARTNNYISPRNGADMTQNVPVIPVNSAGIIIAGLLIAVVVSMRKRIF